MSQIQEKILFTSESVGMGHPDKICDQISDAILDEYLKQDPYSRVAVEALASNNTIVIAGEITSKANVDVKTIVKQTIQDALQWNNQMEIILKLNTQSPDIAMGVIKGNEVIGAGDQGIMFGFATSEDNTPNYMPLAISLAHEIVQKATNLIKANKLPWAKTDMKSQVTIDYSDLNHISIDTVLLSMQHEANYNEVEFKQNLKELVIKEVLNKYGYQMPQKVLINPTGSFVIGGPQGDTGLTGRKIIVDTYGGYSRHGGGAFSGKDSSKVDRSAAYMCRYIAKNLVAAGVAKKLEIQLSYAIGVAEPISINVETFNSEKYSKELIIKAIRHIFPLTPEAIIQKLQLRKPIFKQTATFGHFGRDDLNLPWEQLDQVANIQEFMKNNQA